MTFECQDEKEEVQMSEHNGTDESYPSVVMVAGIEVSLHSVLGGTVVSDPQIGLEPDGCPVCMMLVSFAPDEEGDDVPDEVIVTVVTIGQLAEAVAESVHKGDDVICVGERVEQPQVHLHAEDVALSLRSGPVARA
jgi:hypothetical protein